MWQNSSPLQALQDLSRGLPPEHQKETLPVEVPPLLFIGWLEIHHFFVVRVYHHPKGNTIFLTGGWLPGLQEESAILLETNISHLKQVPAPFIFFLRYPNAWPVSSPCQLIKLFPPLFDLREQDQTWKQRKKGDHGDRNSWLGFIEGDYTAPFVTKSTIAPCGNPYINQTV